MPHCRKSDKSWRVKETFLIVVARQIFNVVPQFDDFCSMPLHINFFSLSNIWLIVLPKFCRLFLSGCRLPFYGKYVIMLYCMFLTLLKVCHNIISTLICLKKCFRDFVVITGCSLILLGNLTVLSLHKAFILL